LQWNTKSFEAVAQITRQIQAIPERTTRLKAIIDAYPVLARVGTDSEFFQLMNDFGARYAEADTQPRRLVEVQIDYGRQLGGRLMSDIEAVAASEPLPYQRWILDELLPAREKLRLELLAKRQGKEIELNSISRGTQLR
jgi:hypothetical protein